MSENKITRRNLLKTVIAASGAIAASTMLPSEWVKPIVTSGVLPVHAQSSPASTNEVRGRMSEPYTTVYALVSSNPSEDFTFLNGKTGLASAGGHAKHAAPARGGGLLYPVTGVWVTLWTSDDGETTNLTKFIGSTNPLRTDEFGITGFWDAVAFDGKWVHFRITGDEHKWQLSDD